MQLEKYLTGSVPEVLGGMHTTAGMSRVPLVTSDTIKYNRLLCSVMYLNGTADLSSSVQFIISAK